MEELLDFAASGLCDPSVRTSIHATVAAFAFAHEVMPSLVLPEANARAACSMGSLAGYRIPSKRTFIRMPVVESITPATRAVLAQGEFYVCPATGMYHECGQDRCELAKRDGATQVCPITSRVWVDQDPTMIDYEDRDGVVMRPTYVNRTDRRVQKRLDAIANEEAFRSTLRRDAFFDQKLFGDGVNAREDERQRHLMELLNEAVPSSSTSVATATAVAATATTTSKSKTASAVSARSVALVKASAEAAAKRDEENRKRLRDRLAEEEKRKAASEREKAKRERLERRALEAKARKPTARRGELEKQLRPVSAEQKLKHLGKFELETRRIPKNATAAFIKDPTQGIAEIDNIVSQVFVKPFKNPEHRAILTVHERKYLHERCRALWKEITQSPEFALHSNRFDYINTVLFVIFHGMRGKGIQAARFQCLPQKWSCRSKADVAQAAIHLKIDNRMSERSDSIRSVLRHGDEIAAEARQRKSHPSSSSSSSAGAAAAAGAAATAPVELTAQQKRAAAIRSWRVKTGETYGELIQRFADRFDNPNAMPVSYCVFSSAARYPPPPPPTWRRVVE
jgi:hypothetical protein